jgi:radical SAM superfamily enzyme YgiQ (UPF0313 family)
MDITLIIPQHFYIANEAASPPLQFEPFYNIADIDFIHLKRGMSLDSIPMSDIYGISAYTVDIKMADIIAKYLKQRQPKGKIVIGGSHATYRTSEIDDIYDYIVVGTGEGFINDIVSGNLPNNRIVIGKSRITTYNQRSYRHFEPYNPNYHRGSDKSYTLRTSLGCYWDCHFCARTNNRNVLFRKVKDIEKQLVFLYDKGIRNLRVIDEICTQHPDFMTLCELFRPFKWSSQTRIDLLTDAKARAMAENGCDVLQVGIESFDEGVRTKLNKKLSDKKLYRGIEIATDNGLKLYCFIMLGTPFDTIDTIKETMDTGHELLTNHELRPDIFCPLPGTAIGDNPEKYNWRMLTYEYEYYSVLCFQNIHGKLVGVPKHVKDIDMWEKLLRYALYELNTPLIKNLLDNPITDWHDGY